MKQKKMVIEMQGGLIEKVYTNFRADNIDVLLLDHDQEGSDEDELTTVPDHIEDLVYLQGEAIEQTNAFVEAVFKAYNEKEG
jgi:hypothetical protein